MLNGLNEMQMTVGFNRLKVSTSVGVFAHEIGVPQLVYISVSISLNELPEKDLATTIDYDVVKRLCLEVCQAQHRGLIETLARDIQEAICLRFSVSKLKILIEKPNAIADADSAFVELNYLPGADKCTGH